MCARQGNASSPGKIDSIHSGLRPPSSSASSSSSSGCVFRISQPAKGNPSSVAGRQLSIRPVFFYGSVRPSGNGAAIGRLSGRDGMVAKRWQSMFDFTIDSDTTDGRTLPSHLDSNKREVFVFSLSLHYISGSLTFGFRWRLLRKNKYTSGSRSSGVCLSGRASWIHAEGDFFCMLDLTFNWGMDSIGRV